MSAGDAKTPGDSNSPVRMMQRRSEPLARPTRYALLAASLYGLASVLYILVSGKLASLAAHDVEDLARLEFAKGVGFVLLMAALIFVATRWFLGRIARAEAEIARQRAALERAERRAFAGTLASSIAHDINNVLTSMTLGIAIEREVRAPDSAEREAMAALGRGTQELGGLARRLTRIAKSAVQDAPTMIDVADIVGEAMRHARAQATLAELRSLDFESQGGCTMLAHEVPVAQAVLNLMVNAIHAAGRDGRVLVEFLRRDNAKGCVIAVHDSGPGVPEELRERIFEALFTTKESGTGLGLVSVQACAQLHGGGIEVGRSEKLGGAVFRMSLGPAAPSAPAPTS